MKAKEIKEIIGYPFVSHVNQQDRPTINNPLEFIKKVYSSPYYTNADNILRHGNYKLSGYLYDFKPYLKKYLYKQYGQWSEIYAPNKTSVRKVIYGRIDKIIQLI